MRLAASYPTAEEAFRASRSGRNLINHGPELEADIPYCARESVLDGRAAADRDARRRRGDPALDGSTPARGGRTSSSSRAISACTTTRRSPPRSRRPRRCCRSSCSTRESAPRATARRLTGARSSTSRSSTSTRRCVGSAERSTCGAARSSRRRCAAAREVGATTVFATADVSAYASRRGSGGSGRSSTCASSTGTSSSRPAR